MIYSAMRYKIVQSMEVSFKFISGAVLGVLSLFAPIKAIVLCALLFVAVDFVSGVLASREESRRLGRAWYFSSREAWRTVRKSGFVVLTIAMTWLVESCILDFVELHLTRLAAGVICGVEMWSFLENASVLSDARLFGWLRQYVHRRIEKEIGAYEEDGKGVAEQ